jgi:predicted O-linked N-acetylglucosamine transferase (SPINDLY family)
LAGLSPASTSDDLAQAIAAHQKGDVATAEGLYRRVLKRDPANAEALHLLGVIAYQRGAHEDAIRLIGRAIKANPNKAEYHSNFSLPLREAERFDEALRAADHAVRLSPDFADAYANRGLALAALRRRDDAVASFQRAIALKPSVAGYHNNLGNAYRSLEQYADAETAYRAALALRPGHVHALFGLGYAVDEQERPDEALGYLQQAVDLHPGYSDAHMRIAEIMLQRGLVVETVESINRALEHDPLNERALHFSVFYKNFVHDATPRELLTTSVAFADRVIARLPAPAPLSNVPDPDRPLRIGFVSSDLHMKHPVGAFTRSTFAAIDHTRYSLVAYDTGHSTLPMKDYVDTYRNVEDLRDTGLADLIRRDGIDILIDLAGYTNGSRPAVFAAKSAPVQAIWLGYSGTSGNKRVDYIIADRWVVPPGDEAFCSEKVARLPDSYLCWTPPSELDVPVAPTPAIANGAITFGSFNKIAKISMLTARTWARVLNAVPNGRLVLKGFRKPDPRLIARIHEAFALEGADPSRMTLLDPVESRAGHFAEYGRIDICLDPFPYNGTTTTVEALWMGVPVLALAGDRFIAHVGESIMHSMGMPEWIASDVDDYVAKAVAFAADVPALAKVRAGLRDRLLASPLCDAPLFARNYEAMLRGMWHDWCRQQERRK